MRKILYLLLLIFMTPVLTYAQSYQISGKVTDALDGSPLPGVTVQTQSKAATMTDVEGNYTIKANKGDVLTFTFIGMASKSVTVESERRIDITLSEDNVKLDEVVVVGYGTMKKSDLTGAVSSISGDRLKESIVTNVDQLLQGRVAGVQLQANSGAPGAANSVRIRGASSINNSNEPLYIIDGIPVSGSGASSAGFDWAGGSNGQNKVNPLASIAPSDIVSMDVLKDASATAIYGAAGANGVVMVTTKRGKQGQNNITYDGSASLQVRSGKLNMMNLRDFGTYQQQLYNEGFLPNADIAYLDPSLLGNGTDWQDAVTKDAWMQNHNLSLTGGTDKTQYAFSLGYTKQDGMLLNSDFERFTGRMNIDNEFNKYIKAGASLSYSRTDESIINNDGINGLVMQAALMSPAVPVYDFDGNYAGPETTFGSSLYNPVALTKDQINTLYRGRVMGNMYAQFTYNKNLNFRTELGIDASDNIGKGFKPSYEYGLLKNSNAQIMQREEHSLYWIWKNYATYNQNFGKHNINFMAGTETSKSVWEGTSLVKEQLASNDIHVIGADGAYKSNDGWKDASTTVSVFGRVNYNYDNRYLLTATLRGDASSKFGANHRWGYFPSFAAAWRVTGESWMEGTQDWLHNLKLRLGYGQVGNSNIDNYLYGSTMRAFPSWVGTAYRMAHNANPDLKWEASEQYNGGLDISLFNGRIDLTVDAYYKTTKDLLLQPSVSPVLGGSEWTDIQTPYMNMGKVDNRGIDIALNTHNIATQDFNWHTNAVFSLNRNEVKELDALKTPKYNGLENWGTGTAFQTVSMITVGQPIGVFYGYQTDGLYKDADDLRNSPRPVGVDIHRTSGSWVGDVKFKDLNGPNGVPDGVIDEYDQTIIGDPNPDFTFGLTNTFTYKGWELGIGLTGSYGADILNYVRVQTESLTSQWDNQATSVLNRAQLGYYDGDNTNVENPENSYIIDGNANLPRWSGNNVNGNNRMSDRWIEDGSYLRIQNLSLAYNLPLSWLKKISVARCKVYINTQNVYTFTNYSGLDPEIGSYNQQAGLSNVDRGRYPSPRIFTFGANITF
jgi:TonB-linked SusC/RagA family outer membrane protein